MNAPRFIPVQQRSSQERRKRRREIVLAAVAVLLIIILSWVELRLLGLKSYLFFALFNVNLILLILVLFLVLRNVIKIICQALAITGIEMLILFVSLLILWAAMELLVRFVKDAPKSADDERMGETDEAGEIAVKAKVAAAAAGYVLSKKE